MSVKINQGTVTIIPDCDQAVPATAIPSAFTVANSGSSPVIVAAQAPGPGGADESVTVAVPAGQMAAFPAPPAGSSWNVVILSADKARRIATDMGLIGLGILGLAAYGGVAGTMAIVRHLRGDKKHR